MSFLQLIKSKALVVVLEYGLSFIFLREFRIVNKGAPAQKELFDVLTLKTIVLLFNPVVG